MRRAARIDRNQGEIVSYLRAKGVVVRVSSQLGDGFVDLVCGYRGKTFLLEVKDGKQPPSRQALTPAELEFHSTWTGGVCCVVTSPLVAWEVVQGLKTGYGHTGRTA